MDKAGNTPLHWAARGGHVDVFKLLLEKNPALNATNKLGDTPLHSAAWAGSLPIVQLLLSCSDIKAGITNKGGDTPLNLAKNDQVAAVLLQFTGQGGGKDLLDDGEDD